MNSTFGMFGNSAQWSETLRFTDRNRLWTGNKYRAKIKAVNPPKAPPAKSPANHHPPAQLGQML